MKASRFRRVFVVGAYLPNGGTHMAYHIGKILQEDFGITAVAVQVANEGPDHGVHEYGLRMPLVSTAEMENDIRNEDILVVNPSFSNYGFGWRLPGFKLCYVQGFNTYSLLDRKFDHYVAVSDFVADFLRTVYDLHVAVIAPFIALDNIPEAPQWSARPQRGVLPYCKGSPETWQPSFDRLRVSLARRAPNIELAEPLSPNGIPQRELLARIGASRYLLTLAAAEGFGLVPLEAMAMGTLVAGYDGYGGRQYMRSGENCWVCAYPDIERVADLLVAAVENPDASQRIAAHGRATAERYTYERFRQAWITELQSALAITVSS